MALLYNILEKIATSKSLFMKDLTNGNITKNIFLQSLPILLSNLLSRTLTMVDSVMVGQFLGEIGIASTGATSGLVTLLSSLFWGAELGLSIFLVAQITGKSENTVSALKTNFVVYAIATLVVYSLSAVLWQPLFSVMAVGNEIYHGAMVYYLIILLRGPLAALNSLIYDLFGLLGNPGFAFKNSLLSCAINVALNYLFMVVFNWGLAGAAMATVLASAVTNVICVVKLKRLIKDLQKSDDSKKPNLQAVRAGWRLALPCVGQQGLMYLASLISQIAINKLGTSEIAGWSVCSNLYNILAIFFTGGTKSTAAFCTQCMGKKKLSLISRGFFTCLFISLTLTAPAVALIMVFPSPVIRLWLTDMTGVAFDVVLRYISMCFPFIGLAIVNTLLHSFFRGVMAPKLNFISTAVFSAIRVGVTLLLTPTMGVNGVFFGFISAWCAEFVLVMALYVTGAWKGKLYREMQAELAHA